MVAVKIFFATDIHGSEICWRKFLNAAAFYKADMVILGGDVTGKVMVPITAHNGYWEVVFGGERRRIESKEELEQIQRLSQLAADAPKSVKWRLRSNVGDRVRWYELPEEVAH